MCLARHAYTTARPVGDFLNCACPHCRNTLHRLGRYSADLSEDFTGLNIEENSHPRCVPNTDLEDAKKKREDDKKKKDDSKKAEEEAEEESERSSVLSDHSDSGNDESEVFL